MIASIKFKAAFKIPGLKAENVSFYCECKCLKIENTDSNLDALIDLCPIHEEMHRKLESGEITQEEAVIPQVKITL